MLVRTGKKVGLDAALFLVAVYSISNDHRVKMTKMRQAVRVVDRCGYVEGAQRILFHVSVIISHLSIGNLTPPGRQTIIVAVGLAIEK
jgi:hypothetical protein